MSAITSITIPSETGDLKNLQFTTEQFETGLYVGVRLCDENWKPVSPPTETTDIRSEEEYHKELRKSSHEKGHFVPQYSTNPEWHPWNVESKTETDEPV